VGKGISLPKLLVEVTPMRDFLFNRGCFFGSDFRRPFDLTGKGGLVIWRAEWECWLRVTTGLGGWQRG